MRMVMWMVIWMAVPLIAAISVRVRIRCLGSPRHHLAEIVRLPVTRSVQVSIVPLGVDRFVMVVRMVCGCQVPAEDSTPGDRRPCQDERIEEEDRKPGDPAPTLARSAASDAALPGYLHRASCGREVSFMIRWGMMERNLPTLPLHRYSNFSLGSNAILNEEGRQQVPAASSCPELRDFPGVSSSLR